MVGRMGAWFDGHRRDPVFLSQSSPTVLMSRDFVVRAATASYLRVTDRQEDELLELNLFEAFPDNPQNAESVSSEELAGSLEATLRTGAPHRLTPIRYDIPDRGQPGGFVEKRRRKRRRRGSLASRRAGWRDCLRQGRR